MWVQCANLMKCKSINHLSMWQRKIKKLVEIAFLHDWKNACYTICCRLNKMIDSTARVIINE